jgi:hypothetical protein
MPRVTVFFRMASTYRFCPMVLALMGLPLAVTHSASPASSPILSALPERTSWRI